MCAIGIVLGNVEVVEMSYSELLRVKHILKLGRALLYTYPVKIELGPKSGNCSLKASNPWQSLPRLLGRPEMAS